jgi:hypothetical protein
MENDLIAVILGFECPESGKSSREAERRVVADSRACWHADHWPQTRSTWKPAARKKP